MDIIAAILASGITLLCAYLAGRYYKRWTAIKALGNALIDALEDDKITPDELQDIIQRCKEAFTAK